MRVLYIDSKFGNPRASSHARVYHFAQRLRERGHEVTIVGRNSDRLELPGATRRAGGLYVRGELDGLDIVLLKVSYAQEFSKGKRMLSYYGVTAAAAVVAPLLGRSDVVVASSSPLTMGIAGVLASRLRGAPFVFEIQDLWPAVPIALGYLRGRNEIRAAEWLERKLYDAAARVVVCSEGAGDSLRERGVPDGKIVLIPNLADLDHFRPDAADPAFRAQWGLDGKFVGIYAGAMGITNRVEQLADAAAALEEAGEGDVVVAVAGAGTDRPKLERRAPSLANFVLLPNLPREEIPKAVAAADVAITAFAPYDVLETNSPNKFFDSLAAGKPAIVMLDGWLRRLVEENRAGVYVPAGDGKALAGALADLARQPDLVVEMGRNARELAEREFARDVLADRLADTVEDAAHDRERAAA